MQLIALTSTDARRREPKRLRLRLFTIAATLTRHGRAAVLTLNQKHPLGHPRPPRDHNAASGQAPG